MLMNAIVFLLAGGTLSLLLWTGYELFFVSQEDPLSDRLEGLQSQAMVSTTRIARRKAGGRGLDRILGFIAAVPGKMAWIRCCHARISAAVSTRPKRRW